MKKHERHIKGYYYTPRAFEEYIKENLETMKFKVFAQITNMVKNLIRKKLTTKVYNIHSEIQNNLFEIMKG